MSHHHHQDEDGDRAHVFLEAAESLEEVPKSQLKRVEAGREAKSFDTPAPRRRGFSALARRFQKGFT